VKYKAITLLGTNVAEKELIHETFHRTAIELPEKSNIFIHGKTIKYGR
jgi:hypothetical protein